MLREGSSETTTCGCRLDFFFLRAELPRLRMLIKFAEAEVLSHPNEVIFVCSCLVKLRLSFMLILSEVLVLDLIETEFILQLLNLLLLFMVLAFFKLLFKVAARLFIKLLAQVKLLELLGQYAAHH